MEPALISSYSAPLGRVTLTLTSVAAAVLVGVGALQIALGLARQGPQRKILLGAGTSLLVLFALSVGLRIQGYDLSGEGVTIRYGFGRRVVAATEIVSVTRDTSLLSGSTRKFANGGLWSFLGKFSNSTVGDFDVYVSDPARAVVLQLKSSAVVISPDNPDGFVTAWNQPRGPTR